jgi:hypothetical protein
LEDYQGGRDFASLKKFAEENLKPVCSPANIDLCDDDKKKEIETFMAMKPEDLAEKIKEEEKKITDAEANFQAEVQKLQSTYQQLMADKEKAVQAVKDAGLGLMKACAAAQAKGVGSDEL